MKIEKTKTSSILNAFCIQMRNLVEFLEVDLTKTVDFAKKIKNGTEEIKNF